MFIQGREVTTKFHWVFGFQIQGVQFVISFLCHFLRSPVLLLAPFYDLSKKLWRLKFSGSPENTILPHYIGLDQAALTNGMVKMDATM